AHPFTTEHLTDDGRRHVRDLSADDLEDLPAHPAPTGPSAAVHRDLPRGGRAPRSPRTRGRNLCPHWQQASSRSGTREGELLRNASRPVPGYTGSRDLTR